MGGHGPQLLPVHIAGGCGCGCGGVGSGDGDGDGGGYGCGCGNGDHQQLRMDLPSPSPPVLSLSPHHLRHLCHDELHRRFRSASYGRQPGNVWSLVF